MSHGIKGNGYLYKERNIRGKNRSVLLNVCLFSR